jgi:hypothetical protein
MTSVPPISGTKYRPDDLLDGDDAVEEFPALTKRHLRTLRQSGTIRYFRVRQKAFYRWIDLRDYLDSCAVDGRR